MDNQKGKTHDTSTNDEEYDPYRKADMIEAQKHRQAHNIRQIGKALRDKTSDRCKCCGFPVNAERFTLTCDMMELSELGSGFPLYFVFAKVVGLILVLGSVIVGIPCIIGNSIADKANDWDADKDSWIVQASLGNNGDVDDIYPLWQCGLHVGFMILTIIVYHISRRWFEAKDRDFDIMAVTAGDYTVHAYGLGSDVTEQEVKEFFEEYGRFDGKPAKVVKVVFAYKIKEYIDNLRKLEEHAESLRMIEEHEKQGIVQTSGCCKNKTLKKEEIKQEMEKLSKIIKKYEEDLPAGVGRDLLTGQAFITFETQAEARAVELKYGREWAYRIWDSFIRTFCCCFSKTKLQKFRNKNIQAEIAYEPNDIFWENLEVSFRERIISTLKTSVFTFIAISITFGMVYGMKILSRREKDSYNKDSEGDSWKIRAISVWPSIIIIMINFILARSTRFSTSFERPHSVTAYNISVALKLTFAMFFNTAVIALIVNFDWRKDWFVPGGLATDATYILISNAIVSPLLYFFSPMVCLHRMRMRKVEKAPYISQHDANILMEDPAVDMAQRFANICKTILLTFCYAPLVPVAFLFSACAIFFEYWVFKYLLLRRHSWPKKLSGDLAKAVFNIIPLSVLLYAVMNFVYMNYLNPDQSELAFIWMLVMIGYNFLPLEIFTTFCIKKDVSIWELTSSEKYEEMALTFVEDYDKLNPITASEGHKRYAELMLKKNVVNKDEFEQMTQAFKLHKENVFKNMKKYAKGRENVHDIEKKKFGLGVIALGNMQQEKEKPKKSQKNIAIEMHRLVGSKITPIIKKLTLEDKKKDKNSAIYPNLDESMIHKDDSIGAYSNTKPGSGPLSKTKIHSEQNNPTPAYVNNFMQAQPAYPQYSQYPHYPQVPQAPQVPQIPQNYQTYNNPMQYHPAYNYNSYYYNSRNYW